MNWINQRRLDDFTVVGEASNGEEAVALVVEKLDIQKVSGLVRFAIRAGLVEA